MKTPNSVQYIRSRVDSPNRFTSSALRAKTALSLLLVVVLSACATALAPSLAKGHTDMTLEPIKQAMLGQWESIAPELRPSSIKNPDGTLKPFYLTRDFKYVAGDRFELRVVNFADAGGAVPLVKIVIRGHMVWRGAHPIAGDAQKVDFIADEGYEVTPLIHGFADLLNKMANNGFRPWEVNAAQSVFGKTFTPFGLLEGKNFMEYDLVHLNHDMLFWGARHVDGRGFDTEQNRPTNLQIPLARKPR